ncbi:hypothetical protein FACS1894124_8460 [Spirochaetia bacterium]|nr:hypothetical protein FACS1894124_8460 [Spirochaetia bacterium]
MGVTNHRIFSFARTGHIWGLYGVVASVPVADTFSLIVTGVMIYFELKKLKAGARAE